MIYLIKEANKDLAPIIKSFWMIDSKNDETIRTEKIVPDGYPEMIFHYGSSFKSRITGNLIKQKNI